MQAYEHFLRINLDEGTKDKKTEKLLRQLSNHIAKTIERELGEKLRVAIKVYGLPEGMTLEKALISEAVHMMKAEEEREKTRAPTH